MHTSLEHSQMQYQPSVAARLARVLLPALRSVLPSGMHRTLYSVLYFLYRETRRWSYMVKMLVAGFTGDSRMIAKTRLVFRLLPFTLGGRKALENAFDVVSLVEDQQVPGALVECGVAEGGTAGMMAATSALLGKGRRKKWFFDSFEGLPEPTDEDYVGSSTGDFVRPLPRGACLGTVEGVSKLLFAELRLPADEVTLVKGWFQDTVPEYREHVGQIAVLRLDGDWYESTKIPLENLYDSIAVSGIVIVDDYLTCFGSRRAVDEFRTNRGVTTPLVPDGRGGVWFEKIGDSGGNVEPTPEWWFKALDRPNYELAKRMFDCSVAALSLVLLSPLLVLIALCVRTSSPGGIFYRGVRTGRYGNPFRIWKFRSMMVGAEHGPGTTSRNDSRVTAVGRVIRKYKLDELPQLINILIGEMSFVGPRPELSRYTMSYSRNERMALAVRPGLTDYSSIQFLSLGTSIPDEDPDGSFEANVLKEKNRLRVRYVRERGFWVDLRLMLRTINRLLRVR